MLSQVLNRLSNGQKVFLLFIFITPIILLEVINYFIIPGSVNRNEKLTEIFIPKGAYLSQISDSLYANEIITDREIFLFWVKYMGYENKMKAGLYSIPSGLNEYQVIEFLMNAPPKNISITFLEGWSFKQINQKLADRYNLDKGRLDSLCQDNLFIKSLGIDAKSLEGYLLPETYSFTPGISEKEALTHLSEHTLEIFDIDSVQKSMAKLEMSVHQILTLASIIEGEVLLDQERKTIASLYYNRLSKNMRLQADPTIQYLLPGPPRRLLFRDLEIDSPYNTYLYSGLPPGPINNPGKNSILAAIFPEQTKYLYMVAVGDGSHAFSTNLQDHLKAKQKFDKVRREVARKKRAQGSR